MRAAAIKVVPQGDGKFGPEADPRIPPDQEKNQQRIILQAIGLRGSRYFFLHIFAAPQK